MVAIIEDVRVRVVRKGKIRREVDRLARFGGGLIKLLAGREAEREQRVRVRIVRIGGERLAQLVFGEFVARLLEEQETAFEVGVHRSCYLI